MEDYKKPLTLKDKLKKSIGMKVREKYKEIPLLSEDAIREKYKEEDWGFLVNYVKQHKELIKKGQKLPIYKEKYKEFTKYCPKDNVKLIKIAWRIHHSHGAGNFPEYMYICPICGAHWGPL